jgi:hypothetical protein
VVALILLVVAGPLGLGLERRPATQRAQRVEAEQREVNPLPPRADRAPTLRALPRVEEESAPLESPQPPEPVASPEEERREVANEEADFLRRTREEPVDARWATPAQAKLGAQLISLGNARGFRVERTECHTTRCLGVVTFPDRNAAKQSVGDILHTSYDPNCGVSILIPEAEAGTELRTNVRFDCEEARVSETLTTR